MVLPSDYAQIHNTSNLNHSRMGEQQLIDWINSFDDPYCVLVSRLPEDLMNGVVISHLVGFISCSAQDRKLIFDLLNYPSPGEFNILGKQQVRENFDLAYNVLKCSSVYMENPKLNFLGEPDADNSINPESLSHGLYLLDFIFCLQSLYFTQHDSSNLPFQNLSQFS